MRLLHSADWQIGARFQRFGQRAPRLREARLRTFRRALGVARERAVDAFLIAGDLFEDHQVEAATVQEIYAAIREFPDVPVFILPGNHDPASGPAAIWGRAPFSQPLPNLKIFLTPEAAPLGDAWLLASPLTQKRSTVDPSLKLAEMAAELPADAIRIGLTHGALAIGGRHAPDDFPIALNAATRGGLDYVAIGHWHSSLCCDEGRLMMAGTPEPTDFAENGSGHVQLVEIDGPGGIPRIQAVKVAELSWLHLVCEADDPEAALAKARREIAALGSPEAAVVRISLRGSCSEDARAALLSGLEALLSDCAVGDIRDESQPEATPVEVEQARADHPLLAGVLDDLAAIAGNGAEAPWTQAELTELCRRLGFETSELTPEVTLEARKLLLSHLRDCKASC